MTQRYRLLFGMLVFSIFQNAVFAMSELSLMQNKGYLTDSKTDWHSEAVFYHYQNEWGKFGGGLNQAKKFNRFARQYQLEANPIIHQKLSLSGMLASADKSQVNFPTFRYGGAGNVTLNHGWEGSLGHGGSFYANLNNAKIYTYTASVGLYFDDYYVWIRPTYYTPQFLGFYEIGITQYWSDQYHYIKFGINTGQVPEIGDVPLQQTGFNLKGQFAAMDSLYIQWGIGAAKTTLDFSLGLLTRF